MFTYFGYRTVSFAIEFGELTESSIQFPMWIYYVGLPIGMALMAIRYVFRLKTIVFDWDDATMAVGLDHVEAQE